jgi:hypothetical protein
MKRIIYIFVAIICIGAAVVIVNNSKNTHTVLNDLIRVDSPLQNASISSPVKITGSARGNWYFEASFPVVVVDWDGRIIGQGNAQAKGDWMTTEYVPFEATLTFDKPVNTGPQSIRGAVILKNDNPSGQASTSKSLEIPIFFQ